MKDIQAEILSTVDGLMYIIYFFSFVLFIMRWSLSLLQGKLNCSIYLDVFLRSDFFCTSRIHCWTIYVPVDITHIDFTNNNQMKRLDQKGVKKKLSTQQMISPSARNNKLFLYIFSCLSLVQFRSRFTNLKHVCGASSVMLEDHSLKAQRRKIHIKWEAVSSIYDLCFVCNFYDVI